MKRLIVIEIPEKVYKKAVDGMLDEIDSCYLNGAVVNGTPLPQNATNGDVIKAMFPQIEAKTTIPIFFEYWWNEPYKAGEPDGK